jgi:hypothetical protein
LEKRKRILYIDLILIAVIWSYFQSGMLRNNAEQLRVRYLVIRCSTGKAWLNSAFIACSLAPFGQLFDWLITKLEQ